MPGHVLFEYDAEKNIVFTEDHWTIKNQDDVNDFFTEHKKFFESLNKKIYMISNIDHLIIHARVAEYYGRTANNTVGHFLLGFARWGTNDFARMTVRTSSLKAKLESNIFNTREEAIQYIEELKKNEGQKPTR